MGHFFLLAFCFSQNWLFTCYFEKFSKGTRLEVIRFFQIFQKVIAVHYPYAKIEVQIVAASQFSVGSKAKNLILCPVHAILRKQLFSDKPYLTRFVLRLTITVDFLLSAPPLDFFLAKKGGT